MSQGKDEIYQPPYSFTSAILRLVAEISERIGRLSAQKELAKALRLRRGNRIRTIHGSLAIEGNTLSEAQITAILEGKRVIAPPREIQEVRNAFAVYDDIERWRIHEEQDLLEAHRVLMAGLIPEPGKYRCKNVGVVSGNQVVHVAPPASRVPALMHDLFRWLRATDEHPLVASSVFHYEFEFIHPFDDGNGRMGRLWQTSILAHWNPLFAHIPIESLVHVNQGNYYQALNASTKRADSAAFVEFMLSMIVDAIHFTTELTPQATPQVSPQVTPQVAPHFSPQVEKLLLALRDDMSRIELQFAMGLKDRKSFHARYLQPALAANLIQMSIPEKPSSRAQRYRLTSEGQAWIDRFREQGG